MNIAFVLGHALYMKAIHGAKTKNDKIDSKKIASLLRANLLPMAYVYPEAHRSTRDLLRRRMYFMHQQSEMVRNSIEADAELLDVYHLILLKLEQQVLQQARVHDAVGLGLLPTLPGIGKILALVMIYEIDDIQRFAKIGNFISYCRLVKPAHESAGKNRARRTARSEMSISSGHSAKRHAYS